MDGVSIRVDLGEATGFLNDATRAAADLTPLNRNIGALLMQSTRDRISITNTGPDGLPWKQSERAKRDGGKTLQDTARLRDNIDYEATATGVAVGTNVAYAAIHQLGGVIKIAARTQSTFRQVNKAGTAFNRGGRFVKRSESNFQQDFKVGPREITMPARPYLGISGQDAGDMQALALDFIAKAGR